MPHATPPRLRAFAFLFALAAAIPACAIDQFWLTDAHSGDATGPFVFVPGTKITIGGATFTALTADAGEIIFQEAATRRRYGPFGFVENRIITLAGKPYYFSKIERFTGANPESVKASTVKHEGVFAPNIPESHSGADREGNDAAPPIPVHRVLDTPPSTNPADHKEIPNHTIIEYNRPTTLRAWVEPLNKTPYDWTIGGFAGNGGETIQSAVFGVSGVFGRWNGELAYASDSKINGNIVPDKAYITGLKLTGGSGMILSGSYSYAFEIENRWYASCAMRVKYQSVSYDLTGTYLTRQNRIITAEEAGYLQSADIGGTVLSYEDRNENISLHELSASLIVGLDYEGDDWGMGFFVALDAYSETTLSGSLKILDEEYALSADKSHPVEAGLSVWKEIQNDYHAFAGLSFGAQNRFRIGIGKRW